MLPAKQVCRRNCKKPGSQRHIPPMHVLLATFFVHCSGIKHSNPNMFAVAYETEKHSK